ncbi:MAG: type II toxin-antitoxin system RelE/ParE family toxin [Chthoniobacter sp.]
MRHEFHPEALEEFEEAAHYYADCQEGLEWRFVAAVENAIGRITETPERWPVFEEDVRRYLTRVFPYAILYTIEPESYVLIVAVMHCRREPGYWRHRLG